MRTIGVGPGYLTLGELHEMHNGLSELVPVNAFILALGKKNPGPKRAPTEFRYPLGKDTIGMLKAMMN